MKRDRHLTFEIFPFFYYFFVLFFVFGKTTSVSPSFAGVVSKWGSFVGVIVRLMDSSLFCEMSHPLCNVTSQIQENINLVG